MIGQEYFDLRSRLGSALYVLKGLVVETAGPADHVVILENLINSLKDPFVFVVAGEVNVGKSTFLNALFGADFSKTGVMPTTDKICFFKHGPVPRRVPITPTLEEVYVPADFLKDFHIVDTPGTNSIESDHQEITEKFVPVADLVIFVFSAMNPWGASAWSFLEKVHSHWMRHVMFILQQCDLRAPEEIAAILDYMRQLCRQRLGTEFPIFPVSAKKAYLARSSGLDREKLMEESGFVGLEQHISKSIAGSSVRTHKIANALRVAREILAGLRTQSGGRITSREEKFRVLEEIEGALSMQCRRTVDKLSSAVEVTVGYYEKGAVELMSHVRRQLTRGSTFANLLDEKRRIDEEEKSLLAQLLTASQERWERAAAIIEDDVGNAAEHLGEVVKEHLKVQLREELRPDKGFWEAQRRRFLVRISDVFHKLLDGLDLQKQMAPALVSSRRLAMVQVGIAGVSVIAAALCALYGRWLGAVSCIAVGGLLFAVGWNVFKKNLISARRGCATRLEAVGPEMRALLGEQLREETQNLYESFSGVLQPTRDKLTEQGRRQISQHEQIENLIRTFAELEEELRAVPVTRE